MNEVLQCLSTEPVPDLLRLAGLLALPPLLALAHRQVRRAGLALDEPETQLPFFDGIPLTTLEPDPPCPTVDIGSPAPQPSR